MTSPELLDDPPHGAPVALLVLAFALLCTIAALVSRAAIDTVDSRHLLPRWDLAAHLVNGWTDYHYLVRGQWHLLGWDLWSQGYWPPGQSLFLMPFYLLGGGDLTAGLRSSLAAFVLSGVAGVALLGIQWRRAAWLPAALFLLFVATSPFFLAYAAVAMSEMPGALAQAVVLLCHARYEQRRDAGAARWFAIALAALFFAKYNFFILLAVPLALHLYLTATAGRPVVARLRDLARRVSAVVTTPTGALVTAYGVLALAVELTGGFAFSAAGQRVAFRTIGYSGHPVLYLLLARVWYLHHRRRIDWARLWAIDPRLRPLALWFALPVLVWLASPYPNHIKDVVNLIVNIPMGDPTAGTGLVSYLHAIRTDYFFDDWFLAAALVGFGAACWRYRRQPPLMQLLILTAALQFVMMTAHQTRDPRFLLLAMPPLWLVAASEIGVWLRGRHPALAMPAAALIAVGALAAAQAVVRASAFHRIAADNYVASPALRAAFAAIRDVIGPADRIAVLGRRDAISPGLVRWQLGPPSGETAFPVEILRAADVAAFDRVDLVVLVAPNAASVPADVAADYQRDVERLQAQIAQGTFVAARTWPIDDAQVSLQLYRRRQAASPGP